MLDESVKKSVVVKALLPHSAVFPCISRRQMCRCAFSKDPLKAELQELKTFFFLSLVYVQSAHTRLQSVKPLALELDIYSLAHNLCKLSISYEPRRVTLGNT